MYLLSNSQGFRRVADSPLAQMGGIFEIPAHRTQVINFANQKVLTPQWHQIFLRTIGGMIALTLKQPNSIIPFHSRAPPSWTSLTATFVSKLAGLLRRVHFDLLA